MLARYKSRLGFICGKFEADFWYYELLEMTRKTMLMAVACELLPLSLWPELLPVSYCPLATAPLSPLPLRSLTGAAAVAQPSFSKGASSRSSPSS